MPTKEPKNITRCPRILGLRKQLLESCKKHIGSIIEEELSESRGTQPTDRNEETQSGGSSQISNLTIINPVIIACKTTQYSSEMAFYGPG